MSKLVLLKHLFLFHKDKPYITITIQLFIYCAILRLISLEPNAYIRLVEIIGLLGAVITNAIIVLATGAITINENSD